MIMVRAALRTGSMGKIGKREAKARLPQVALGNGRDWLGDFLVGADSEC